MVRSGAALLLASTVTACGSTTRASVGTLSPSPSPSPTALPPIGQGSVSPATKIVVPYTRGSGTRQLHPTRAYRGAVFVEYACIGGGMLTLQFAGTVLRQFCDDHPYAYLDDASSVTPTSTLTIAAPPTSHWYVRATSNP